MKKCKRLRYVSFLLMLFVVMRIELVLAVGEDKLKLCERELEILESASTDLESFTGKWEGLSAKCEGTGLYEYQLSKLYIAGRDYKKASEAIEKGLEFESPYKKELFLAKGDLYLHQRNYLQAEKAYRDVVNTYPKWNLGYGYLGFALFAQGKNLDAIHYLKKANELEEHWDTYRTLTLAYYLLEDYEMAVDSLNRAFSLSDSIIVDRDPMVAGIRSYAELGKFEIARKLLAMMLDQNSEFRNDEEYLNAGLFVRQKMIDAGLVNE